MNTEPPAPPSEAELTPLSTASSLPDVMDAPPPPREPSPTLQTAPEVPAYPAPLPEPAAHDKTDKKATKEEVEAEAEEAALSSETHEAPPSNGVIEVELDSLVASHPDALLESPIAQPEELRLPNGMPLPAPLDPEVPAINTANRDDSPIAEPDVNQQDTSASDTPVDLPAQPVPEVPPEPEVQSAPAEPEVQETVPPVALDIKEDAPVPQSTAKEDTPSPAGALSIAESTPEIEPTPPPPSAEEKEDAPPPQTVAPVEPTMQGQPLTLIVFSFCSLSTQVVKML